MNPLLAAALTYAARGWPVFPLRPRGKKPITEHGYKDATNDPDTIRRWWQETPNANIGIPTGAVSGLVVVDVDGPEGEAALVAQLNAGDPIVTPTARTGKGRHILFAHPGHKVRSAVKKLPGLDVRGDGGYIVAPPSVHESGNAYAWELAPNDAPLTPMPVWLLTLFETPKTASGPSSRSNNRGARRPGVNAYAEAALRDECGLVARARPGERNATLNRAAFNLGQLVSGGTLERERVETKLFEAAKACCLVEDGEAAVLATIESGIEAGIKEPRGVPESQQDGSAAMQGPRPLPTILVRGELGPVTDEAEAALLADPNAGVYVRGRDLTRVVRDTGESRGSFVREKDSPVIQFIPIDALREKVDRAARWVRWDRREKKEVAALPPLWVPRTMAARGSWRFPRLEGVIEAPTMRRDGTILERPGYDDASGLLLIPSQTFPPIPERPSRDDAIAAAARLLEPFAEFPFLRGDMCDRAAAVAAVLSLVVRHTVQGCVPMFAIRARAPGTGKGLLADVVCIIGTGRAAARMSLPRDDAELRKVILTMAIEGSPAVLIDNVDRALGSHSLAAALTAPSWKDRVLGLSRTAEAPLRTVWIVTGNGLTFKGDLPRRVVLIDLDAGLEHPEDRTSFSRPDLLAWVRENRPQLVVAALTILRAYHLAGRPGHACGPRMGSFENWDDVIRGSCVWVQCGDPCSGTARIRNEDDSDLAALGGALEACAAAFGSETFTAAEAVRRAEDDDGLRAALLELLASRDEKPGRDKPDSRSLGYALRYFRGRPVGRRRFERAGEQRKGTRWCVEVV